MVAAGEELKSIFSESQDLLSVHEVEFKAVSSLVWQDTLSLFPLVLMFDRTFHLIIFPDEIPGVISV